MALDPARLLHDWWPLIVPVLPTIFVWYRFELTRRDDREKRERERVDEAERVRSERVDEARRIETLREERETALRGTVITLAQQVAKDTIRAQQERIEELEKNNAALRKRADVCDAENAQMRRIIEQLRGEIGDLKQVMTSSKNAASREKSP